jgi:hypothetical protein
MTCSVGCCVRRGRLKTYTDMRPQGPIYIMIRSLRGFWEARETLSSDRKSSSSVSSSIVSTLDGFRGSNAGG